MRKKIGWPGWRAIGSAIAKPFVAIYAKMRKNRSDATHKTFVRTRRRDKVKKPKLEGYIAFPWYVARVLWNRKWIYIRAIFTFLVLSVVFIGAIQADNIASVGETINSVTAGGEFAGPIFKAFTTVGMSMGGALNSNLSEVQYVYLSALAIFGVLTIVWLLRHQLAGNKLKLRDAMYSSASPIVAQYVLLVIAIAQMLPAAIAVLVYVSATASNLLQGGIETAMFSIALALIIVLTLYFMTTTLFAMFIATIPGTYPMKAYRTARQIVAGQRLRLLLRLTWMIVVVLAFSFVTLVPIVIVANSFGGNGGGWVIAVSYQLAVVTSILYGTAYSYLLYRRMIDDPVDK